MESSNVTKLPSESRVAKLEKQFFGHTDNQKDPVEFDKIFKIIRRYKWLLLITILMGAGTGYLLAASEQPLFRAATKIIVEPESSNRSEYLNDRLRYYIPKSFYETQHVVIKSRLVLEHTARSISPSIIEKLLQPPQKSWIDRMLDEAKKRISNIAGLIKLNSSILGSNPVAETATRDSGLLQNSHVVGRISSGMAITFGSTQQLLKVSYVFSDPLVAAIVVNAIADSYISYLVENRVSETERAGEWLAGRVADSREKLSESENALKRYQYEEGLPDLQTVISLASNTLSQANSELLAAEQRVVQLSKKYGSKHPALIEAKRSLANLRGLYSQASRVELNSSENKFELTQLERAVNSDRELYELFQSRFNEVELGVDAVSSNTKIIERAKPPVKPFSPDIKRSAMSGAVIGLLIGLLFLSLREFLDRTYKNQIDVENRLQLPVLGVLPLLAEGKLRKNIGKSIPERYYLHNSKSNFSEDVNHIRTGILFSNIDRPPKVILITSALPKEGKTTCATNLALAFSKLGKTLLIDADFRKPRIAKIVKVENVSGLTGYVAGQNSLQECVSQDAGAENLFIMHSGEIPPNPLELLSSKRFEQTLELMKEKFDYILIDSAPIIPVSDGIVLGRLVDEIVMILKASSTAHQISEAALKRLYSANLKPAGIVLAQLDYRQGHYYYGKYDYYKQGYYG